MSRSVISLSRQVSTLGLARAELDRIEQITGDRPVDWFMDQYDESIDDFYTADGFDWDAFSLHLGFIADGYIDFINEHVKDLTMDF